MPSAPPHPFPRPLHRCRPSFPLLTFLVGRGALGRGRCGAYSAKAYFNNAVLNDTLFLSLINVVDYSILVGMDEDNKELVVGIIDYMRQYDIIKKMERMGKSVGMIAGQAEPTVIQPPNYRFGWSL